jgi:hypothetical protein
MNPAAMICYVTTETQFDLTREAVASVMRQDVDGGVVLWVHDNGSTLSRFWPWLNELPDLYPGRIHLSQSRENESPLRIGNRLMSRVFREDEYFLGVPNDVILPCNFYRELLKWPVGLVTASMTAEREFPRFESSRAVSTHTPMAVGLFRKWMYDALMAKDGFFFDERYFHYASDLDLSLRMAACGVRGVQLDIQYFHSGSGSWRLADPETARQITSMADVDRARFVERWGFGVSDAAYGEACGDINFRGESK